MNEFVKIWNFESEFGWDKDVIFEPFWDNHGLFEIVSDSTGGKVIASVFRRDGRFLLAILNDSPKDAKVAIKFDLKQLIGKDAPTKIKGLYAPDAQHKFAAGVLNMEFKPREGDVIWIE